METIKKQCHRSGRWMLVALTVVSCLFFTVGCNTVEGVGEDIEAGGEAMDEAAEDAN